MVEASINYTPETCARCNGTGIYGRYTCDACGGQGSALVAQPARKCARCDGRGSYDGMSRLCEGCGGAGWAHALRNQ